MHYLFEHDINIFFILICSIFFLANTKDGVQALSTVRAGEPVNILPWYSYDDVKKHCDPQTSVWVVFKQGVYDITEFAQMHPGGEIIMKAAGKSIEPFWAMYGVHLQEEVFELLETYRIGRYVYLIIDLN